MTSPIRAKIRSRASPATVLTTIDARRGPAGWRDQLNDLGSWTLQLARTDPDLVHCLNDRLVSFELNGTDRFLGLIEGYDQDTVSEQDRAGEWRTLQGRGALAIFDDAVVYPELGIGRLSPDSRLFNFASTYYDDSAWDFATQVKQQSDNDVSKPWRFAPDDEWPDEDAWWIWSEDGTTPQDVGFVYGRAYFTLAEQRTVRIFYSADDGIDLYVDGAFVTGETKAYLWAETKYTDLTLDAGDHIIAARAENIARPDPSLNFASFIVSVVVLDQGGQELESVAIDTSSEWFVLGYPAEPPGMTVGQVLGILFDEAQARGALTGLAWDFDDTLDSDGEPWPTVPDLAFSVGTKYTDVLKQLTEEGYCDVRMAASSLTLHAYVEAGAATGVHLQRGVQLTGLKHSARSDGEVNVTLSRFTDGYVETADDNPASSTIRKEAFLSAGDAQSTDAVARTARATFTRVRGGTLETAADVEAVSGSRPYVDFGLGDTIITESPSSSASAIEDRVEVIEVRDDAEGYPVYSVTLGEPLMPPEARNSQRLAKDGTIGGRVRGAARVRGVTIPPPGQRQLAFEVPFSLPGALTTDESPRYYPRRVATLRKVLVSLGTAGTSNTVLTVYKNGSSIGTVTLGSGVHLVSASFSTQFLKDTDYLTVAVTTIGTGAPANLTAHARFGG